VPRSAGRHVAPRASVSRWVLAIAFSLWWLATLIVVSNIWIVSNFGQLELPQFVYHIVNLPEVIQPMGFGFVALSVIAVVVAPISVGVLGAWATQRMIIGARALFTPHVHAPAHRPNLTLRRSILAPGLSVGLLVPSLVLGLSTPAFAVNVGVVSFVENSKPSGFIEGFYEFPEDVLQPEKPLNLVMIYVESLENTYRNPELWGENLLDSLDRETADWATFPDFQEVRGTGWTIAGLVASQCGVLLKEENQFDLRQQLGLASINRIGENVDSFMPGITCLGDILDDAGYSNHFIGGADPEFAGKGKFFEEHGYDTVKGRPYWESIGETEFTKWGLHDDKLLNYAKRELDELHAAGEPFNLTVLTVDTHRPEGHLSATCERRGASDLPGIVACTSDLLADFVRHMERRGYLEDTVVVITGDHLSMPNVVQDTMDLEPHRTIYNRFWSPLGAEPNRSKLYHFSILPTVLTLMGFEFPGNEMALGVSGVGNRNPAKYSIYDVIDLDDQLRRPSELYNIFWETEDRLGS
jgi:phosphoglycerol transferase